MAQKKVITVTDLGPGDGGKGGVVHKLCTLKNTHTVIKVGGAQGSHGVRTLHGESFNFSHIGCGTFNGVRTHVSNLMVIEPYRFCAEAVKLRFEWGISNIYEMITVDGDALCITPFHGISSRLRELARGVNQKGTVGLGGGEAVRDSENLPQLAIYAKDCNDYDSLLAKLVSVQELKRAELAPTLEWFKASMDSLSDEDVTIANEVTKLLNDDDFPRRIALEFNRFYKTFTIVDRDYLATEVLGSDGTVVVESSHGILTDRYNGFHPHTSYLRTLPQHTINLLKSCGYDGEILKLGITRGYQIRHGAGPFPTESPEMLPHLLPGSNKDENRWQGKVRVGPLDLTMLRYAIEVCGGPSFFNGLAITWFDQIELMKEWKVAMHYTNVDHPEFFTSDGRIKPYAGPVGGSYDADCFKRQQELGSLLKNVNPHIVSHSLEGKTSAEIAQFCKEYLQSELQVTPRMISFGATEDNKLMV